MVRDADSRYTSVLQQSKLTSNEADGLRSTLNETNRRFA